MKVVVTLLIAFSLAFVTYAGYRFFRENNRTLTPIPEEKGVKVIYVTPSR